MSGPKDYSIAISASRIAQIAVRREMQQRRRDEALRLRAEENRRNLEKEAEKLENQRRHAAAAGALSLAARQREEVVAKNRILEINKSAQNRLQDQLETRAARNREALEKMKSASHTVTGSCPNELRKDEFVDPNAKANLHDRETTPIDIKSDSEGLIPAIEVEMVQSENRIAFQEKLADLLNWRLEIDTDQNVLDFATTQREVWLDEYKRFSSDGVSSDSLRLEEMTRLIMEAKKMLQLANEVEAKFQTRNEILADVIASLKEIGFVVQDPFFEDNDRPDQPVNIYASRGNETMKATIDMSQEIRSVWNDIEKEDCMSTFYSYVDSLDTKGLEVKSDTIDLTNRPMLNAKGAKDLPIAKSKSPERD